MVDGSPDQGRLWRTFNRIQDDLFDRVDLAGNLSMRTARDRCEQEGFPLRRPSAGRALAGEVTGGALPSPLSGTSMVSQ